MNTEVGFSEFSAVSEASYVRFDRAESFLDDDIKTALRNSGLEGRFSESQATDFV